MFEPYPQSSTLSKMQLFPLSLFLLPPPPQKSRKSFHFWAKQARPSQSKRSSSISGAADADFCIPEATLSFFLCSLPSPGNEWKERRLTFFLFFRRRNFELFFFFFFSFCFHAPKTGRKKKRNANGINCQRIRQEGRIYWMDGWKTSHIYNTRRENKRATAVRMYHRNSVLYKLRKKGFLRRKKRTCFAFTYGDGFFGACMRDRVSESETDRQTEAEIYVNKKVKEGKKKIPVLRRLCNRVF